MDDMVPQDHMLRLIDRAIDWTFIYTQGHTEIQALRADGLRPLKYEKWTGQGSDEYLPIGYLNKKP